MGSPITAVTELAERVLFENYLNTATAERNEKKAFVFYEKARQMLLKKITPAVLDWKTVRLDRGHTVQVCLPVRVHGPDRKMYYVPVTPKETWSFARQFSSLPLTGAVFDQYHNQSIYVPKSTKHNAGNPTGLHFHTFSEYLNDHQYHFGMKSGAHKLWILSNRGFNVNHGFYVHKPKDLDAHKKRCDLLPRGACEKPGGKKLDPSYWLFQNKGAAHEGQDHWDYSQLLQLMRSEDIFNVEFDSKKSSISADGAPPYLKWVKLREAILEGLPEVWDEGPPPAASKLP
jgi:hypothetical protein